MNEHSSSPERSVHFKQKMRYRKRGDIIRATLRELLRLFEISFILLVCLSCVKEKNSSLLTFALIASIPYLTISNRQYIAFQRTMRNKRSRHEP